MHEGQQLPFRNKHWSVCSVIMLTSLVGGLEHVLFFRILGIIIPADFHICFYFPTTNEFSVHSFYDKGILRISQVH